MNLFAGFIKLNLKYVFWLSLSFILFSFFLFFQFLKPVLEEDKKSTILLISLLYVLAFILYTTILLIQWRLSLQLQIFDPAYSFLNYVFWGIFVVLFILFVSILWQTFSSLPKMTNTMMTLNMFNLLLLLILLTEIVSFVFFHPYSIVLEIKNMKTLQQRKNHLDSFLCQKNKLSKQQYKALQQHWRNLEFTDKSFQDYLQKKKDKICPCPNKTYPLVPNNKRTNK